LGARFVPADVTDTDAVNAALDVAEETGPIRALVHCAGRGGDRMRIIGRDRTPSPLESFRQVLDVNLVGT
jgi:NAD(P)-dependent dehydrogenase (short-subunit alcohol dehydrogenase family)